MPRKTTASGAPGHNEGDEKQPMKLLNTSVCISKRSKAKGHEDSPMAGRVKQNDQGGKADASGTPEDDKDNWDMLMKLQTMSGHVNESSK